MLLGDFGLACAHKPGEDVKGDIFDRNHSDSGAEERKHSVGVGTYTYSAPEQLNSKTYGSKVAFLRFFIVTVSIGVLCYFRSISLASA